MMVGDRHLWKHHLETESFPDFSGGSSCLSQTFSDQCTTVVPVQTLLQVIRDLTLQMQPVRAQGAMVRASRAHNLMRSNEAQH